MSLGVCGRGIELLNVGMLDVATGELVRFGRGLEAVDFADKVEDARDCF